MHFHLASVACALLVGGSVASPTTLSRRYALKERHPVPRGWRPVAAAPASHVVNLHISLKQSNQDLLDKHAIEVSDPSHERYGQYLSADEIADLLRPSDQTYDLVNDWLFENDVTTATLSPTGDSMFVLLPVSKVEELLDTKYAVYRHEDGSELIRTPDWSLPQHLHEHIDVVQPTNSFFRITKKKDSLATDNEITWHGGDDWFKVPSLLPTPGKPCDLNAVCNVTGTNLRGATVQATTLTCLRCLYGTINYVPRVPDKNAIGVTNYLNETQVRSDVRKYLELYRPEAVAVADQFPIIIVNGGQDEQNPSAAQIAAQQNLEGNLDGEIVLGISYPTKFNAWNTGGEPPFIPDIAETANTNEPYLEWQAYVLAQKSLPQVISTSYADDEQTVPFSYATRVCDGFKQLAARGISLLFSSGDAGVGANGTCYSNTDPSKAEFLPLFPPSCPWVTAVGGTQDYAPEVAVQRFGSGAGFSNYFGRPLYQALAVGGYLAQIGNEYAGLYNRSGRAYPDVAAQANHDVVVYAGQVTTIGGTSAAAPAFAAVISLVNDALIAAGRPALGFLNPWIYGGAFLALTDVTSGSSVGCDTAGFPATVGWDAVTGFGTPNFDKLKLAAFAKLF